MKILHTSDWHIGRTLYGRKRYEEFSAFLNWLTQTIEDETAWLTQAHMAELFQVKPQNITMHLKNIYAEGELAEESTCKEFLQVQQEGARQVERKRKFYTLDAIIK